MSVDLEDLVPSVRAETSPPGTDLYPNATDDDFVLRLENAFWECKLFGFAQLDAYTEADGTITTINVGDPDIPREEQQLIILFAAATSVRMSLLNVNTAFKVAAGTVSFETQSSANMLSEILKEIQFKIDIMYAALAKIGRITDAYMDSLAERDLSLSENETFWWGADHSRLGGTGNSIGSW